MSSFRKISAVTIGQLREGMAIMKYPVTGMIILNGHIDLPGYPKASLGTVRSIIGTIAAMHSMLAGKLIPPYAIVNTKNIDQRAVSTGTIQVFYKELMDGRWWIDEGVVCPA